MKYCVPYYKTFKYMEEVDEVIVPFIKEDVNFIKSLTSKEKVINGTVIIEVQNIQDLLQHECVNIFLTLKNHYADTVRFKLKFDGYNPQFDALFNQLKANDIPFFFSTYARDWDVFNGLMDIGVSDIYIVEELAFSLGKLGSIAHAKNISIRCFANVAQSKWVKERSIKSFFIRPEDILLYDGYVDVIEFFGENQIQYETLYKVYAINKKWPGPLQEVIIGLESEVNNMSIIPAAFAKYRLNCDKRCAKGSKCSICERFVDVADQLFDDGIIFKS